MKHTPGKWYIGEDNDVFSDAGTCIANVIGAPEGVKESTVNARLIAAAPELLEACKMALELIKNNWIEEHGNKEVGETWGKLEKAIALAEGKE